MDSKTKQRQQQKDMFYLLVNSQLRVTDIGTFLEQMLLENLIPFKYSDKTFKGSLIWLQAKHCQSGTP